MSDAVRLMLGDCVEKMAEIESGSVDAIITDPPYPEVSRSYGRMTELEWHSMMDRLIPDCRRVLKSSGSAVFILQPNSEKVGRMRPWLWEFMAKWTREWGMVQDAWWWNWSTRTIGNCDRKRGLLRPSVKAMVWLGNDDCYRDQSDILIPPAESTLSDKRIDRHEIDYTPCGAHDRKAKSLGLCRERGGVTPFNLTVCGNGDATNSAGSHGHGAGTPYALADWWTRYISPPDSIVCDPFMGSGTMGLAALARGRSFIGIERDAEYFGIASDRIAAAQESTPLLTAAR